MRKKITTLLVIALLSAQVTPAFAQYGPNGLCDPAQMRMCGEQVQKGMVKAGRFVQKHEDQICGSPFFVGGPAYFLWSIRRAAKKAEIEQDRNKKVVVNTQSYELNDSSKKQEGAAVKQQPAAKKQAPTKKK